MEKRSLADTTPETHDGSKSLGKTQSTVGTWWLAGREATGAEKGAFAVVEFIPGAEYGLHRHSNTETALFVIEGSGLYLSDDGEPVRLDEWDAVYLRPGESQGFRNDTNELTRVALIIGRTTSLEEVGGEKDDASGEDSPQDIVKHSAPEEIETSEYGGMWEEAGLRNGGDEWYFGEESVGAENLQVRVTRFEAGGGHFGLHRHTEAEEFFYVLRGSGFQLSREGEIPLGPGELVFTPVGEDHGWRNSPNEETFVLAGWFGAASPEGSGYEQIVDADDNEVDGE